MRSFERVRASLGAWRELGVSERVLSWIAHGVPSEFVGGTPPPPFNYGNSTFSDPREFSQWLEIRASYLKSGGLELVPPSQVHSLRHICRAFMVGKPDKPGKFRLVVDGRPGNAYYVKRTTSYESLSKLPSMLVQGGWTMAFDISDAYHHLALRERDRNLMAVCIHGEYFRFAGLPFGWTNSPYFFTEFMGEFTAILRSGRGTSPIGAGPYRVPACVHRTFTTLRTLAFLDDFLLMFRRLRDGLSISTYVKALAARLGLSLHPTKTCWTPKQSRRHLGIIVDSLKGEFRVPPDKLSRVRAMAKDILCHAARNRRFVTPKSLTKFAGLCVSLYIAMPAARMYLRSIYDVLRGARGNSHVKLSKQAMRDLAWWLRLTDEWNGRAIWRHPDHILAAVDASSFAWGGLILAGMSALVARGYFSKQIRGLGSTHRELLGVRFFVQALRKRFANRHVVLLEDNTGVEYLLRHFSSRTPALQAELRRLSAILAANNITLEPIRVASADNPADAPSRYRSATQLTLASGVFTRIQRMHGLHTVDRFASWHSTRLQLFNCGHGDARAAAIDCFTQLDWHKHNNFCQPPVRLISDLVHFLLAHPCDATVCVPHEPAASWLPLAMQCASQWKVLPASIVRSPHHQVLPLLVLRFTARSLAAYWRPRPARSSLPGPALSWEVQDSPD